jgi:hypothetical protein
LNAGAWARGSERVTVSLPMELEDYIPEVEDFYKKKHSGRKLQWYHHMSNGTVCIACRIHHNLLGKLILCCNAPYAHMKKVLQSKNMFTDLLCQTALTNYLLGTSQK